MNNDIVIRKLRILNSIFLIIFTLLFYSCSNKDYFKLSDKEKFYIDKNHLDELNGQYEISQNIGIFNKFNLDTISESIQEIFIDLEVINKNLLRITLFSKNQKLSTVDIEGKFRNGYFRFKKGKRAEMIFGPLL